MKHYPSRQANFNRRSELKYAINDRIRALKLLVIDENGEQLGVLDRNDALQLAREKELDLIEVSPNTNPPVAKILSWSKFKYQQEKKKKENKSKSVEMKEMWFKVFIEKGDLEHKLKKVREFLAKKHPVKLSIRGRGKVTRDKFETLMKRIVSELENEAAAEETPKFDGRNMTVIIRAAKAEKITQETTPEKKVKQNEKQN